MVVRNERDRQQQVKIRNKYKEVQVNIEAKKDEILRSTNVISTPKQNFLINSENDKNLSSHHQQINCSLGTEAISIHPISTEIVEYCYENEISNEMCGKWLEKGHSMRLAAPVAIDEILATINDVVVEIPKDVWKIIFDYSEQITKSTKTHYCEQAISMCEWINTNGTTMIQPSNVWISYFKFICRYKIANLIESSKYRIIKLNQKSIDENFSNDDEQINYLIQRISNDDLIQSDESEHSKYLPGPLSHSPNSEKIILTKATVVDWKKYLTDVSFCFEKPQFSYLTIQNSYYVPLNEVEIQLPIGSIQKLGQPNSSESYTNSRTISEHVELDSSRELVKLSVSNLIPVDLLFKSNWTIQSSDNDLILRRQSIHSIISEFLSIDTSIGILQNRLKYVSKIEFGVFFQPNNEPPVSAVILYP